MNLAQLSCTSLCTVIDCLEVGVVVLDAERRVLHWNRWLAKRSNKPALDVFRQDILEVFPEIANTRLLQGINQAIQHGLPALLSPALNGTTLPLYTGPEDLRADRRMQQMIHILPLRDTAGEGVCIVQINDVTANISRERLLRQQAENLRRSNSEDPLTGIPNRRKFDEMLSSEFRKAQLCNSPLAIAIADIDLFNQFNLHYGREHGDQVLAEVAGIFRNAIRPAVDLVARYGGEEFAFILPGATADDACQIAENLRLRVLSQGIANEVSPLTRQLTVSIGIAVMVPDAEADTHTLLSSADVALYQAKHEGRNQSIFFSVEDGSFKSCH